MWLTGNFVQRLGSRGIFFASCTSLANPLLIGISADTGLVWVQYVGAVIGSIGFSTALHFRASLMQWYSLDNRASRGASLIGLLTGMMILVITMLLALLLSSLGLAKAMYAITAIMMIVEVYPLWLAMRGELGGPSILGGAEKQKALATASTEYRTSLQFWQLCLHTAAVPFVGFGMKALTTTISRLHTASPF
jgi:hypothetical protein